MNAQFKATNPEEFSEEDIIDTNIECLRDGSMRASDLLRMLEAERTYYPEVVEK